MQEEDSISTALVSKNLHFSDYVPQHFKQPDRSLRPASACMGNSHRQQSPTSTDETSWGITLYI